MLNRLFLMTLLLTATTVLMAHAAAAQSIDRARAEQYFVEAQAACSRDAGKLWGVSLCGPLMFTDPQTRMVVANQADADGALKREGNVYVGDFPKEKSIANQSVVWSGTRWTQLRWPLYGREEVARQGLMLHEMFHRLQQQLGLPMASPANAHLDSEEGRVLLRAEMRALRQAMLASGAERKQAARDALAFRAARRNAFASAAKEETDLELNEGLCEYTGIRLSRLTPEAQQRAAADVLKDADASDSYVRSFAYATGPAYGILLDEYGRGDWRKALLKEPAGKRRGLEQRLAAAIKFASANAAIAQVKGEYGLAAIKSEENARSLKQAARRAEAKARFIDGRVLVIPLVKANAQFDPTNIFAFGSNGTIYPEIRLVDEWGILTVKNGGALLAPDWSKVTVAASGEGWELELKPGWGKQKAAREGDWTVVKDSMVP